MDHSEDKGDATTHDALRVEWHAPDLHCSWASDSEASLEAASSSTSGR
jgi:hypothetical protein